MKIYKYQLTEKITSHQMPIDAEILSVQMQRDVPTFWALVNPENKMVPRTFWIIGTGEETPTPDENLDFLGTIQETGGFMVWHIFEEIR